MVQQATNPFEAALKRAEGELTRLDIQIGTLELERATLRQTVAALKSQLGIAVDHEFSLTDAILMIVDGTPGPVTVNDVRKKLATMNKHAKNPSIATILSRLVKRNEVVTVKNQHGTAYSAKARQEDHGTKSNKN